MFWISFVSEEEDYKLTSTGLDGFAAGKNDWIPYLLLGPNVQPVIGQYRAALVARQHRYGEERSEGAHIAEVVPVDGPPHAAGRRLLLLDEFRSLGVGVVRLISCKDSVNL